MGARTRVLLRGALPGPAPPCRSSRPPVLPPCRRCSRQLSLPTFGREPDLPAKPERGRSAPSVQTDSRIEAHTYKNMSISSVNTSAVDAALGQPASPRGAGGDIGRGFAPVQRDRPQQPRDGAGREPPPPPRPRPCAPGAPAQPPLPAAGGGTDSRLPNPVSHWYEHRAGNVTRPAATSLPPGCTGRPCPAAPRYPAAAPGGTGHPRHGLPRAVPLRPRAAPRPPPLAGRPARTLLPAEGRGARGKWMLFLPVPRPRRCLCVRVCPRVCVSRPACPRVSPRVRRACTPARHVCPATCGERGVCGERGGPGPTCGAGGADTPGTTTPSQRRAGSFLSGIPGGKCQLRRSTAMCLSPPPALTACFSLGLVLLPPFRGLRLLEVRDLQTRAPTESGLLGEAGELPQ